MRITVQDILECVASGMTEEDILQDFSELTREDIKACLAFATDRERRYGEWAFCMFAMALALNLYSEPPNQSARGHSCPTFSSAAVFEGLERLILPAI